MPMSHDSRHLLDVLVTPRQSCSRGIRKRTKGLETISFSQLKSIHVSKNIRFYVSIELAVELTKCEGQCRPGMHQSKVKRPESWHFQLVFGSTACPDGSQSEPQLPSRTEKLLDQGSQQKLLGLPSGTSHGIPNIPKKLAQPPDLLELCSGSFKPPDRLC